MKKLILALIFLFVFPFQSQAIVGAIGATSLTGGGTGALDAYDGSTLNDLDVAIVTTGGLAYFYVFDADSAAAESSPGIISPDSNAGDGRWILSDVAKSATITTLANDATPSISAGDRFLTGGTTTITDFDDGYTGQIIYVIAAHSLTITDGTNIFLSGSAIFEMTASDTLTLIQQSDTKWYELARGDNGA